MPGTLRRRRLLAPSTLLRQLVGYFALGEASGTRLDAAGLGSSLSPTGTPGNAPGIRGSALALAAASTESLSVADTASLSMGDIDFTLAGWFYAMAPGPNQVLVSKGNLAGYATAEYSVEIAAGPALRFFVGNGAVSGDIISSVTLAATTWYFFRAWHDSIADTLNLQINNGAIDSTAYTTGSYDSGGEFAIGRWAALASGYWDGRIEELGIWKRILSSTESGRLFNSGGGRTWPFAGAA